MIQHTVFFTLKHAAGSAEETDFLNTANGLAEIPGVQNFKRLREVSPKNEFQFGLYMEFADEAVYQSYNDHPVHVDFVQNRWIPEVADFQEIDYIDYP